MPDEAGGDATAEVAEQADATVSKTVDPRGSCRFQIQNYSTCERLYLVCTSWPVPEVYPCQPELSFSGSQTSDGSHA